MRPLAEVNPSQVEDILSRPFKTHPIPEGVSESRRQQLARLLPFKGWTESARRKIIENKPTRVKMIPVSPTAPEIPDGMPVPVVPTAIILVRPERTMEGKYARAVLSKEEYDLYVHTWMTWLTSHPEWTLPEDLADLGHICMEKAVQFRLMRLAQQKGIENTVPYNASYKREQQARENLTARRVDRTGTKAGGSGGGKTIVNVAVLSGEIPPEEVARRRLKKLANDQGEQEFLQGTVVKRQVTIDEATPDEV